MSPMPIPTIPVIASASDDVIYNIRSEETGQSAFACIHCRKQKIKCDRLSPVCSNCKKASKQCDYPLTVQKPGPKAGTHRRPRNVVTPDTNHKPQNATPPSKRVRLSNGDAQHIKPTVQSSKTSIITRDRISHGHSQGKSISHSLSSKSPSTTMKAENTLFRLVHPSHDPQDLNTTSILEREDSKEINTSSRNFARACRSLGVTTEQARVLIDDYFENMTAFSLFHRPTFETKISNISSVKQLQALLAAIFAWSIRFHDSGDVICKYSTAELLEQASKLHVEVGTAISDEQPPLHYLQSLLLVTYQYCILGMRGKTWRMLGECIRLAYELRLNTLDLHALNSEAEQAETEIEHERRQSRVGQTDSGSPIGQNGKVIPSIDEDSHEWVAVEEKRRLWWALWEMDIFASCIRRLPTAIDERMNLTWLPSSDADWFNGDEVRSCFLNTDADKRWREVANSGNRSSQAWYILINSYMFDAHKIGVYPEIWASKIGYKVDENFVPSDQHKLVPKLRDLLDSSLSSTSFALPQELTWRNEFLTFDPQDQSGKSQTKIEARKRDSAKYIIHIMIQLTRLMIYVWDAHRISRTSHAEQVLNPQNNTTDLNQASIHSFNLGMRPVDAARISPTHSRYTPEDRDIWQRYVGAANSVADCIRKSRSDHYRIVNPLICNGQMYAAAGLVVTKLFGPSDWDHKILAANFETIMSILNKLEQFWHTPSILKIKLRNLEDTLDHLKRESGRTFTTPTRDDDQPLSTLKTSTPMSQLQHQQSVFNHFNPHTTMDQSAPLDSQTFVRPGASSVPGPGFQITQRQPQYLYGQSQEQQSYNSLAQPATYNQDFRGEQNVYTDGSQSMTQQAEHNIIAGGFNFGSVPNFGSTQPGLLQQFYDLGQYDPTMGMMGSNMGMFHGNGNANIMNGNTDGVNPGGFNDLFMFPFR